MFPRQGQPRLLQLAEEVRLDARQQRRVQRKLDRQRRANNPANYDEQGRIKRQGKQRAKFFDDARGSAVECAACLDALVARKLATIDRVDEGKKLLF